MQVIRDSNRDVGGRVVEMTETEYVVRGRGYLRGMADIENLVVKAEGGTPVLVRDLARVEAVADERRGIAELDGQGEVVAGIAVARYGQNAQGVIHNLKARISRSRAACPRASRSSPCTTAPSSSTAPSATSTGPCSRKA